MEDKQFESIIELKIADIISMIIELKKMSFEDSLQYFYTSQLYEALTLESTKIWHLSTTKLVDMLEMEKKTNVLLYPDFV